MGKRERRRRRVAGPQRRATTGCVTITDLLSHARALEEERRKLDCRLYEHVDRLRAAGVGWPTIGEALGVSRQAARQRALRRNAVQP